MIESTNQQPSPDRELVIDGQIRSLFVFKEDKLVSTAWGTYSDDYEEEKLSKKMIHISDMRNGKLLKTFEEDQEQCDNELHYPTLVDEDKIISALPDGSMRILDFSVSEEEEGKAKS